MTRLDANLNTIGYIGLFALLCMIVGFLAQATGLTTGMSGVFFTPSPTPTPQAVVPARKPKTR